MSAGKIRVFKADDDKSLILLGEDRISHTPKNEDIGLKIANIGPINAYVARIESTPDVGVEIRNAKTDPLPAPLFFKCAAMGITPQEHTGRGIPINVALIIEKILFPDKCL